MQTEDDTVTVPEQVPEEKETVPEQVPEEQETEEEIEDTAVLTAPEDEVIASIESINLEDIKANAEYPETVVEKISSRLSYDGIYEDTDVVFDLTSNQVKESIILKAYRDTLKGYAYVLEVGDLTPVLLEGGEIELRDADGEEIVMYMPAPYLIDAAGATCFDIDVSLDGENGKYVLAYELPREWLADSERKWPVVLDPAVLANTHVSNIKDTTVYTKTYLTHTKGILALGYYTDRGLARSYIKYQNLPELTAADVIVNASLTMYKPYNSATVTSTIEVHKVNGDWASDTITWDTQPAINATVEDFVISKAAGFYTWDITDIARSWYEDANYGLMLKYPEAEENVTTASWKEFYSSEGADYRYLPNVLITFRNNNGLESYWDYTTSSAGRAGTGYVNQYTGNLVWIRDDIGFGGNRMPVTISHVYNANDSTENLFGMGYGWRTNFNQRVYHWDEDTAYGDYYVWEDSDGTDHYFLKETSTKYNDEDGLELTLTIHGSGTSEYYLITDKYGNTSRFDNYGRLVKQENNQATKSSINITYTTTDGLLISTITDGVGRVYSFTYSNNLLSKIAYKGKGTSEITYVNFGYTNSNLMSVTDKDSKVSRYTYTTNNLMSSAQDIDGYKINYAYTTTTAGEPNRIKTITEYSGSTAGGILNITYAHNQTKFTDYNGNVQIVQFNNMGNTISIQDDQGRAQYAQYAINDPTKPNDAAAAVARASGTAKGNQLLLTSKLQNTVGNVLNDSSFENGTLWGAIYADRSHPEISSAEAYSGNKSLAMVHTANGQSSGLKSPSFTVGVGETYTFSGYVKTDTGNAYLCITDNSVWLNSEVLPAGSDWTRLEVSYTNTGTTAKSVTVRIQTAQAGTTYLDCVQVEKAPTASRYNLIQNGDFRTTGSWTPVSGRKTATAEGIDKVPAPQLDTNVYKMTGNPKTTNRISQTLTLSGSKGDTFVLAGWAKADSVPIRDNREFALIATFKNGDAIVNKSTVRFNPCADSTINWQYAASPIVATGAYDSIVIELAYDYNANTVYFDGVQLYKEEFGNSYTYDEEGNIISVKDVQSQTTSYEYTNNNLTKQILPSGAALTYTYDNYHNVKTATSDTGVVYKFNYDTYGNNTSVSIVSGNRTLTSSATYTTDGNRLASTTDAAGKVTTYSYNENTNVLEWVQYPEDTTATRTEYTYDNMYRLAKAEADVSTGSTLKAEYGYTNDLLTSIKTGSTTYTFNYGAFALRSNIMIGTRTLATYSYTSRNNFLDTLAYGNNDHVKYVYDTQGRVTKETYEDGDTVTYKYDNSGALASVTDSATGITSTYYYDYTDRLLRYAEKGSSFSHIIGYEYDEINNLTALVETINGTEHKTTYGYDDDNRVTSVGNGSASEAYTYDAYSRVNKKVTKNGSTTVLTDNITYRDPTTTTTSGQVYKLQSAAGGTSGYNVTYTYTYDNNGNIETVNVGGKTTKYTYDSANQLTREDNEAAGKTWVWTYDDAGNILSKKEYAYTTGTLGSVQSTVNYTYDGTWGDLLTGYNGKTITSDTIGNMLSDGTWTYTWEHGRELATMSNGSTTWTNTYNADGLRTKRTNGSTTYNYIYNGSSLSQMTVGSNTLYFAYDASGTPMSVTYNGTNYYYATNVQGDVTAILNTSGTAVVQYTYDAWGKILATTGSMASTLGAHNPLRYRGYVYDTETTLYYLQSRYYNPAMGRFISSDSVTSTGGLLGSNLFTYCLNNPVNMSDSSGNWPELSTVLVTMAAAAMTVAVAAAAVAVIATAAPALIAVGGAVANAAAIVTAATTVATQAAAIATASAVASVATKQVEKKYSQTYSVYFLEDENGQIQYVGRVTDRGYSTRMAYHYATRGLTPKYRISDLNYAEARGLEEIGMIECHTLNAMNPKNNQIHGISPKNQKGERYMEAACDYLFNRAENWVLNLLA